MKQYHIGCEEGQVGKYVILTGDPGRCKYIAENFEKPHLTATNREFVTYSGYLNDKLVSVISTGIGGPSAAIAMEEAINCGAQYFVRIGTCGGINIDIKSGELIIPTAAIRGDGTSEEYAPINFPATADYDILSSLVRAAKANGIKYHTGIVQCKDSFYGQHKPDSMPIAPLLKYNWDAYKKLGVLASEMESATLYIVAATRGVKCGTVLHTVWNQERKKEGIDPPDDISSTTDNAVLVAIEGMKRIIAQS